jgi:ribosomal protein S28E/S33
MRRAALGAVLLVGALVLYAQDDSRVVIREISGTVEVKEPGAADWVPARQGQ